MTREKFQDVLQDLVQDLQTMGDPISEGIAQAISELEDPSRDEVLRLLDRISLAVKELRREVKDVK